MAPSLDTSLNIHMIPLSCHAFIFPCPSCFVTHHSPNALVKQLFTQSKLLLNLPVEKPSTKGLQPRGPQSNPHGRGKELSPLLSQCCCTTWNPLLSKKHRSPYPQAVIPVSCEGNSAGLSITIVTRLCRSLWRHLAWATLWMQTCVPSLQRGSPSKRHATCTLDKRGVT